MNFNAVVNWFKSRPNRVWLYLSLASLVPLLTAWGYVRSEDVPLLSAFLISVLGLTGGVTAIKNVPVIEQGDNVDVEGDNA